MSEIKLKDIIKFDNWNNVKIRFNLQFENGWDPIEAFKDNRFEAMLNGQYWNYKRMKSYRNGQITIGFIRIKNKENLWLLFHIGRITKDLEVLNGVGYEHVELSEFKKYFGRLIVRFKNTSQNLIRNASSVIDECEIEQILPNIFDNDIFPGYDNVNISWIQLSRVIDKNSWQTALSNQKAVYLITDEETGKMYVGSAYGEDMLLGRWQTYAKNGHGGNKELKALEFEHIKNNFRYSILEIFKSMTDDNLIIGREGYWKAALLTRKFGYNIN